MGGKGNFRKAKLTAEMNDVLESGRKELEDFGIIVNQCKVEVGGSDKFDSTWRQAQAYNESLTEGMTTSVYIECKDDHRFISNDMSWDEPDTLFTAPKDIDNAKLFNEATWKRDLQEILDELTYGYSVSDFRAIPHFEEDSYFSIPESLTESRNPEHEKANKIIRKMRGYGELTDKEIQELKRVGIDPKKMTMDRWNDWQIIGPNGRKLTDMSDSLPRILKKTNNNFDIVGYLTKQHDDKEIDPVDALQPYRKEKEAIKKAGESERKAQERKQRAIQAAKEKHQKK